MSSSSKAARGDAGLVQFEQRQDFLGDPTDGWYWRDDACQEPMGPFATLNEARDDYRKMRPSADAESPR